MVFNLPFNSGKWAEPKLFVLLIYDFQVGYAVLTDRSRDQTVNLGDLSAYSCILAPHTCSTTEGGSLAMWIYILDSPNRAGMITSQMTGGTGFNMHKGLSKFR